ncbi:MAG: type IV pilus modification PilV family protein [Longimicrobiales bacterium]
MAHPYTGTEDGFTLIEVIVALLIMTVGLLALAGTTGAIFTQMRIAERRTERMTAVQQVAERFYAISPADLETECSALNEQIDAYTVTCDGEWSGNLYELRIVSVGPGYRTGTGWRNDVADTFAVFLSN